MISSFSQEQFQQFYEFCGGGVGGGEITEKYNLFIFCQKRERPLWLNFHMFCTGLKYFSRHRYCTFLWKAKLL